MAAASQGTMNNLTFGDTSFGYYETICGGSGATRDADGADAVHTHMTNTRLTDPEVLERRYPVRIHEFRIRPDSGGPGARKGGNGVIREIEFLRPVVVSMLSERRGPYPPVRTRGRRTRRPGPQHAAACGHRAQRESRRQVPSSTSGPGDVLRIETPGGGGFGPCELPS